MMMLPIAPITDSVDRSSAEYSPVELRQQPDLNLLTANVHNKPLIQFFNSGFEQADSLSLMTGEQGQEINIACFQEISEEDAHKLSEHGDVIFAVNNDYPLNGKVGIALFSRRRIADSEKPNLSGRSHRPAILATIDNLRFACMHLTRRRGDALDELDKLNEITDHIDFIMGDLNLDPEDVDALIASGIKFSSRTDQPTLKSGGRAIDRIIVPGESRIIIYKFESYVIEIHSDHMGVLVKIKPSNWANTNMRELK